MAIHEVGLSVPTQQGNWMEPGWRAHAVMACSEVVGLLHASEPASAKNHHLSRAQPQPYPQEPKGGPGTEYPRNWDASNGFLRVSKRV